MLNPIANFIGGLSKSRIDRQLAASRYPAVDSQMISPPVVLRAVINKARGTISLLLTATGCFVYYNIPLWVKYRVKRADVSN
jgi:hypothetical protein